ncbi:MAG: HEAT repeat domain-containing protein [Planctomycetota bacterium]|nr:HEAT repeat domain-containing protein [Planctomycetota bacterium]
MSWRPLTILILATAGCATWRTVGSYEGWSLHEASPNLIQEDPWRVQVEPAKAAVEAWLGPFQNPVQIHALAGPVHLTEDGQGVVHAAEASQPVAGMHQTEVRGYHLQGTDPSQAGKIFVRDPSLPTLVHELVHARLAEDQNKLPLWFEEGVACLLSDGLMFEEHWVRDGFAAWPWAELHARRPDGLELQDILDLDSMSASSVRQNVLAHLVGWALVFDLWRETRSDDWNTWYAAFDWKHPVQDAQRRLDRVLSGPVPGEWLRARLTSSNGGVRLAALRGAWKLASPEVGAILLGALEMEKDPEVRIALAVNLLASGTQVAADGGGLLHIHECARTALSQSSLPVLSEALAVRALLLALEDAAPGEGAHARGALEGLRRFWDE